ncbi:MAG: hypothetical protein KBA51_09880 [Kiritimatiellae bacterium]|nr:hypothetical protein [Kiritimatiellia bacterium]
MRLGSIYGGLTLGVALSAAALGPHELLVIVHPDSQESLTLANRFVELRGVPPENVLCLAPPASAASAVAEITPEQFSEHIWTPATDAAQRRRLNHHILAWVFSSGYPARLNTSPPVSLTGAVFARNQLPPAELVTTGHYASALFRGPVATGGEEFETISLDEAASALGPQMPLPAMMLGWTGARGLTLKESLAVLERGAASDGTRPPGPIYLLSNEDVRSRCRDWQFPRAAGQMSDLGLRAVAGSQFPSGASGVAGLMMGVAEAPTGDVRTWAPGAFAEHLTSHAAEFHRPVQTKLTEWLISGATCSAGTVAEPYSLWTKFPSARLFAHLGAGAGMLEALAQSVASPMQLLAVGDPLASPWGQRIPVTLDGPAEIRDVAQFRARAEPTSAAEIWLFLLDGRPVARSPLPEFTFRASALAPGAHILRAVAYGPGPVRAQGWAERPFIVPSTEAPILFRADESSPGRLIAQAPGASRIGLYHWGRAIREKEGEAAEWDIPASLTGSGRIPLDAVAQYPDGFLVRAPRVWLSVSDRAAAPELQARKSSVKPSEVEVRISLPPTESAPILSWRQSALEKGLWGQRVPRDATVHEGEFSMDHSALQLTPGPTNEVAMLRWPRANGREWSAQAEWPSDHSAMPRKGAAVLIWGDPDTGPIRFFGMLGTQSAWAWGDVKKGRLIPRATLGAPLRTGIRYALSIRLSEDGKFMECRAGGDAKFRVPAGKAGGIGSPGLAAGAGGAEFREIEHGWPVPAAIIRTGQPFILEPPDEVRENKAALTLETRDAATRTEVSW